VCRFGDRRARRVLELINFVECIFWVAAGVILYTFLGYALLVGLLSRWMHNPVERRPITPRVSLIVAAYNEAAVIARKLENSLGLDYPAEKLEVVVVSDGSDDDTVDIVAGYADRDVLLYHRPQREGKGAAINRVASLVSGEILVFSDANTMIDRGALRALVRGFADPEVGAVSGEKQVRGGGEGLYWRYESFLKRCDSALTSVMGAAGEFFAVRRGLFRPTEEDVILEDFVLSLRLVEDGWRVAYESAAITREDSSPTLGGDWQRRTRNAAGGFQAIVRLRGLLHPSHGCVAWQYLSHRVMRWAVTPFLLPVAYVSNGVLVRDPFYRALFVIQSLFYAGALLGYVLSQLRVSSGPLHAVFYFCFGNAAAVAGFWRYFTGRQPVTWTKGR